MHQDFLDRLRAFIDRRVRFLVVGAYALGVHGRPRATGDWTSGWTPRPTTRAASCCARAVWRPTTQVTCRRFQPTGHRPSDGVTAGADRRPDRIVRLHVVRRGQSDPSGLRPPDAWMSSSARISSRTSEPRAREGPRRHRNAGWVVGNPRKRRRTAAGLRTSSMLVRPSVGSPDDRLSFHGSD